MSVFVSNSSSGTFGERGRTSLVLRDGAALPQPANVRGTLSEVETDDTSIDLSDLIQVLLRRKRIILGTIVLVLACVAVALVLTKRLYYANAIVMLDQRTTAIEGINAVLSGLPTDTASIQNQVQILTSRELASRVIDKMNLDLDPEFNAVLAPSALSLFDVGAPVNTASKRITTDVAEVLSAAEPTTAQREAVIAQLLARVSAQPLGASTAVVVSVGSDDAAKSAQITNALAEAYVEDQIAVKSDATQRAVKWLTNRAQLLAVQVQGAESAVQQYKMEHGITDIAGGTSVVDQQVVNLNNQLSAARVDLAQKEAIYGRVLALRRSGRPVDVSQVVGSQLIIQLRNQEADLARQEAQLASRYLPDHPKMLDISSQKLGIRTKIDAEVDRLVESVENDVVIAQASVNSLQRSLGQIEATMQGQNKAIVGLKTLEAAAAAARSMYEALLSRLKEIQGQEGIATADARIISRAVIPVVRSPSAVIVIAMAVPASIAIGLLLAFIAERLGFGDVRLQRYSAVPQQQNDASVPETSNAEEFARQQPGALRHRPLAMLGSRPLGEMDHGREEAPGAGQYRDGYLRRDDCSVPQHLHDAWSPSGSTRRHRPLRRY